jgi:hypothetical protein
MESSYFDELEANAKHTEYPFSEISNWIGEKDMNECFG